jgi:hypothetical protein
MEFTPGWSRERTFSVATTSHDTTIKEKLWCRKKEAVPRRPSKYKQNNQRKQMFRFDWEADMAETPRIVECKS